MSGATRRRTMWLIPAIVVLRLILQPAEAQIRFDLEAQPLGQALMRVASLTSVNVFFDPAIVKGAQAPALQADLSADEALARLLAGTHLRAVRVDEHTIRVIVEPVAKETQPAAPPVHTTTEPNSQVVAPGSGKRASDTNSHSGTRDKGLDEILVTAEKREELLQDVPISISVLSTERLDGASYQDTTEALTTIPGVAAFSWGQGGGTLVAIRGVTASYPLFGGSSPISYYLDGVPFGLVDTAIAPNVSDFDLQRIEVLRGPQGTLYGASALNGVIRVLTNDADLDKFDLNARVSDSESDPGGNNYHGDLAVNVPLVPGALAMRAVVGYQSLSGWIDKPNDPYANGVVLRNGRLKINAQPTEALSVGITAWLSYQDYGAPATANDQGRSDHRLPEPISTDYGIYGLRLQYRFSQFTATAVTSYLNYATDDELDYFDFAGTHDPLFESSHAHVFSEELNFNSTMDGPWHWSAGLLYRAGRNSSFQTLPGTLTLDWTDDSRSLALFGEAGGHLLSNKLEWTLGARYFHDDVTTKEGSDVAPINGSQYYRAQAAFVSNTPRAVLSWHPAEHSLVYASFSEGFRSGAPQTYYITRGVGGLAAVRPDQLYNYELGAKSEFLDGLISVDTAVYYMDWRHVQQQLLVPFGDSRVAAVVNGQSASGPGIDLSVNARPYRNLQLGVSFSWNGLTVDRAVTSGGQILFADGDRLNFSPQQTLGAMAGYAIPIGKTDFTGELSVAANYTSALLDRAVVDGVVRTSTGNSILVIRTGLALLARTNWDVTLFADNVTNEQGAVYRSPFDVNTVPDSSVRVRPRTVGLQFHYRYQ